MKLVYLDHSATTPVDPAVVEAMLPFLTEQFGNASSVHAQGRLARAALERSRETIAEILGARGDEVYFTSGGTESDNHAVLGSFRAMAPAGRVRVVTSAIEHHAVLHSAETVGRMGGVVTEVPVDAAGMVDPDAIRGAAGNNAALISVMHANNEVGTIEPIGEIARAAHEAGALMHTDAVQSFGKVDVNVNDLGVDLLSLSAHKIYGPKGVGGIFIRRGTKIEPFLYGGAQESNRRAGTENVAAAVGFAKAAELCRERMEIDRQRIGGLRNRLRESIRGEFQGVVLNGHPDQSLYNLVSVSFDGRSGGIDGEALIMGMDLRGVAVTSGSACTSGSLQPSHVLLAMGRDEETARATIRFSLGRGTTKEDVDYALEALRAVVANARKGDAGAGLRQG